MHSHRVRYEEMRAAVGRGASIVDVMRVARSVISGIHTCSGAQSKCGRRAIKGTFRRTIGENIGDDERALSEIERTIGETDARSSVPTHIT
jgi:hypothetical protein